MRGKAERFHIEGMLQYRIRKNHIAPQWSTMNWFGTAPITLATAHSFSYPFLWAKSVSSAPWRRFASTLSIIQYISIMACFGAYLPYLTKTYLVNGMFTQFKRKKKINTSVSVILYFVANSAVTKCFSIRNFNSSDNTLQWICTEDSFFSEKRRIVYMMVINDFFGIL